MILSSLIRVLCFVLLGLSGIATCAPIQPDLANPMVKGDRSTISNDLQATDVQKTEAEQ
jgi:hypothetical protein